MTLILCHAAKGGVGTTFIAAQIALGIARRGLRVTAVDFTYQDTLKLHFGLLPNQFAPDFASSRREPLALSDVSVISGHAERCDDAFRAGLQQNGLGQDDGIVVADIASSDRELVELLRPHADLHLSVLVPDPAALASLTRLGGDMSVPKMERTAFVLNALDDRRKLSRHSHRFIREIFGDQLIGTVRRDEAVPEALATFEELPKAAPQSVALADLETLTDAVLERCGVSMHAGIDLPPARQAG